MIIDGVKLINESGETWGQNYDRLRDFVLVKFVCILRLWKTIEENYGVERVAIRVGCWAKTKESHLLVSFRYPLKY